MTEGGLTWAAGLEGTEEMACAASVAASTASGGSADIASPTVCLSSSGDVMFSRSAFVGSSRSMPVILPAKGSPPTMAEICG